MHLYYTILLALDIHVLYIQLQSFLIIHVLPLDSSVLDYVFDLFQQAWVTTTEFILNDGL